MSLASIQRVGVLGAGQMGAGIAQVMAGAGLDVRLADVDLARAEAGKESIAGRLRRVVDKDKMTASQRDAALARICPVADTRSFSEVDLAIEAASESVELKRVLMRQLDDACSDSAIVASNTSSISITLLAAATTRPHRVIGMHFMNPVPVMKLVEVIRALPTDEVTYSRTVEFARALGKTVITSKDCPGFIVNRILIPMINEAGFALQEGLGSAEDIDTGAKLGLNHPMGPLELADLIGLDTCLSIADVLHRELGEDKYRAPNNLRMHVAAGWLGRKSGRGFYDYRK
ncbi:MAG: 3-hydroxyacyl-CoA dehydrogenase NAD-binding domain-containing protein [Nannocystaceae bacterium]